MKAELLTAVMALAASATAVEMPGQQIVASQFLKPAESRKFSIDYVGVVTNVPPETKVLRVWFPVPLDSTVQMISDLRFSQAPELGTETKYGNKIAYWEIPKPARETTLRMSFVCARKEINVDLDRLQTDGSDPSDSFDVFRKPDKLVLVDQEIKSLARQVTAGKQTSLARARAIYDHVLGKMTYDKNHVGWGLGSTRHACDV